MRDITKDIVNIVKAQTGQDATQNTRKKEVVEARMMVYKMLNEIYQMNITEIGREFGKNHATIHHALNKNFDTFFKYDNKFRDTYVRCLKVYGRVQEDVDPEIPENKQELIELISRIPENKVEVAKIRLDAMLKGFGIQPRGQEAKVYTNGFALDG